MGHEIRKNGASDTIWPKGNPDHLCLWVVGTNPGVRAALEKIADALKDRGCTESTVGTVQIVLAEIMNNVVEHGMLARTEDAICTQLDLLGGVLVCEVRDKGCPYPGARLPSGRLRSVEELERDLPEGGFGWSLIRMLTEELEYDRENDENCIRFMIPVS